MTRGGEWIPNPLPASEMSAEDRLDEVAMLLAGGLARARARRRKRRAAKFSGTRENCLEVSRDPSAHGFEPSRNGERRP